MSVFVDPLLPRGWKMRGRAIKSSHLFTDGDLAELHELAQCIGLRREWFQQHPRLPHYDVTPSRRAAAVAAGAREVDSRESIRIMRARTGL